MSTAPADLTGRLLDRLPELPARPTLRPGFVAVRRDADQLQVGIDPPQRVVLPDVPEVRELLASLRRAERPRTASAVAQAALAALVRADLVVDAAALQSAPGALLAATYGAAGRDRSARRAAARVEVRADAATTAAATSLLTGLGCTPAPHPRSAPGRAPDLVVVAEAGPVARSRLDDLVRDHVPHLLVSAAPGLVRLGPLAVAGVTACVRCVDAHEGEQDPRRSVVWEQVAHLAPGPTDPSLWSTAVSWAVRDAVAFVDGDTPATWSATIRLEPGAMPVRTSWLRHPHCGCSWGDRFV